MDADDGQRVAALARANRVRIDFKDLKQEIREGLPITKALHDPRAQRMMMPRLLEEQPHWGRAKVARLTRTLAHSGIRIEGRRVERFTARELNLVIAAVMESPAARHLALA